MKILKMCKVLLNAQGILAQKIYNVHAVYLMQQIKFI